MNFFKRLTARLRNRKFERGSMEQISLSLGNSARFDSIMNGSTGVPTLKDGGDLEVVTKDLGTTDGRAVAVLTFTVESQPGVTARAQTVVTVRNLETMLALIHARYEDGKAKQ